MSDPFLFSPEDAAPQPVGPPASDCDPKRRSRWKRALKWGGLIVFGVFLTVHVYSLALRFIGPPGTLLVTGQVLAGVDVRRNWVPLEDVSPHLVRAVIAAEDQRFCKHRGVDTDAIRKAYREWQDGEGLRGGSTITQQTAKNVFLWNGGGIVRKVPEAWMACVIDVLWGKRRVMEVYLNVAEWGDGLFGAEAAARVRFGKHAKDLTAREAALLATVLPSPNKWRVDPPGPYVQKRSQRTLAQMRNVERDGLAACVLD